MQTARSSETGITASFSRSPDFQASPLARSVPPTGIRLTKILGQFRVHLRSIARQIGPEEMLKYVHEALRQDFHLQEGQHHG
jgi:hypothetical protein